MHSLPHLILAKEKYLHIVGCESKPDCFPLMAAAPWECCKVLVGFLWGSRRGLVGVSGVGWEF